MNKLISIFAIAFALVVMTSCGGGSSNSTQQDNSREAQYTQDDPTTTWIYTTDVDDLTGKTTGINAFLTSTNSIESNIGTTDRLIIQIGYNSITRKPSNMFGIAFKKGDCRFADKNSQGFYAVFDNGDVDDTWTLCNGGSNKAIVMISDGLSGSENKINSFINKLKNAKTCRIQVNVDGVGMKTFNFNCEGLKWDY